MTLAIFDLDNTLIAGDSDHLWGEFLVEKQLVDSERFKQSNDRFYEDYCRGELDIEAYLRFALEPLTQFSSEQLNTLHSEFMAEKILPIWLLKAEALVDEHRQAGHTLLVITATNRFVTEPIVNKLRIPNLLASEGEIIDGRYTGNIADTPCYAGGKVIRLNAWLEQQECDFDLAEAYFYSDSFNDLPLLKLVGKPRAVDPDPTLKQSATSASWPILSLR
ncbi:HAD family hydrolase [Agaribacterium haliotis]|uniref:histidinol-phosphatase n=1 Tax=Agaribacterium haliotis TaxID=2013869 RepID=UPI000BB598DC|nr:HAD family hydrolase [Agaribacterium haliotis]